MSDPRDYTVGWISATATEYVAAQAFLDERHEGPEYVSFNDNNDYTLGRVGKLNVVIAVLPDGEYGIPSTTSIARDMLHSFPSVRFGLIVGIGGGAPSPKHDIRLGDIVVSTPRDGKVGVLQYDFGKTIQDQSFRITGFSNQPPIFLRAAVNGLKARYEEEGHQLEEVINSILEKKPRLQKKYKRPDPGSDRLYRTGVTHPPSGEASCVEVCSGHPSSLILRPRRLEDEDDPTIHYGLIASANKLMENALVRDTLAAEMDVLCFDMGVAGLINFPCLVIRGVCDYSDSHKNKEWQGYAAMAAAAYTKDLLRRILPHRVEAENRISYVPSDVLGTISRTKLNAETIRSGLDRNEDLEILNWLTPIDYGPQQSDYIMRRKEGTGQWLLDSDAFQMWLETSKQTLFCPGIPGAGKTILTSIVVDYLITRPQNNPNTGFAYLYCNFQRQAEQKAEDLLASLLKQLSQARSSLPDSVRVLYNHHKKKRTRPLFDEISRALQSVAAMYSRVFIIVDALDECQVFDGCRLRFLSEIFNLQVECGANVFATSRFVPDITKEFEGSVSLEIRAIKADVREYIRDNMSQLPSFVSRNVGLQEEIVTEIAQAADGMFLLARLHLDSLIGMRSPKAIRMALRSFRDGPMLLGGDKAEALDSAYEQAMERIGGQIASSRELAKQVLSWITCAMRPITTLELQHALAIGVGASELDSENLPEIEDMVSVCAGLVTVSEESDIIRFIHYSTQEYFERTWTSWFPNAQADIARISITYLSFDAFETGFCPTDEEFEARLRSNVLYDYAARNWGHHARAASLEIQLVLSFLESKAKLSASNQALMASKRHINDSGYSQRVPQQMTGVHLAAYFGLVEVIPVLLGNGHDPEVKDAYGRTPLSWAAERGCGAMVKLLLSKAIVNPDSQSSNGRTPLSWAAANGHGAVVEILLHSGAGPDSKDGYGRTPLQFAGGNGHEAVVEMLLEKGADPDSRDGHYGQTPLSLTAEKGHEAVVKLLLDRGGVNPDSKDSLGRAPLSLAAEKGHEAVVKLLLDKEGINPDSKDSLGRTPLSLAAEKGHEAVVGLLLDKEGVNPDSKDSLGRTPLSLAAEMGHEAVVKLLFDKEGVDPDSKDSLGRTPLAWAAERGHEVVVRLLLAKDGASPDCRDGQGRTPLWWAAEGGHEAVVKLLLATTPLSYATEGGHEAAVKLLLTMEKADPDSKDGRMPLLWAARIGHELIVKLLLAMDKIDPDPKGENNRTPLSWAAESGYEAVVKLLLATNNVDPDSMDNDNRTPLSWAAERGRKEVVELLLATDKVNPNSEDGQGQTPLWWAAEGGHEAVIKLLLAKDEVDPDFKDSDNRTPLSRAAESGYEEVVKLLLDTNNVDPDSMDNDNRTPLSWAAERGRKAVVELLLATDKVNPNFEDRQGRTPLSWAAERGNEPVTMLLLKKDANIGTKSRGGWTALHYAAKSGHRTVVQLLLESGSDVNLKGSDGATALREALKGRYLDVAKLVVEAGDRVTLHTLVQEGEKALVKLLLETAPNTNPVDFWHRTPMHTAVMSDRTDILEELIAPKSNVDTEDIDGVSPLYLAVLCGKAKCINLLLKNSASTRPVTANQWRSVYKGTRLDIVMLTEREEGRAVELISEDRFQNELIENTLISRVLAKRLFLLPNNSAWEQGQLMIPLNKHQKADFFKRSQLQVFRQSRIFNQWSVPLDFMKRDSSDIQDVAQPTIADIQGFRFTVAVSFPVGSVGNRGEPFGMRKMEWKIISWTVVPLDDSKGDRVWKMIDCFSMLTDGSMPDNGVDFFNQFMLDLQRQWLTLHDVADQHLTYSREYVLEKNGTSPTLIRSLLKDAQKWTELRRLLRDHAEISRIFESKYMAYKEYRIKPDLASTTSHFEREITEKIGQLDRTSQDLIQMEFNLVSINEARRSTSTSTSMKRLSWITFIFLPAMFASSLFGMNVNILKDYPDWRWYILFGGTSLTLTMVGWLIFKYNDIETWVESLAWKDIIHQITEMGVGARKKSRKKQQQELP